MASEEHKGTPMVPSICSQGLAQEAITVANLNY